MNSDVTFSSQPAPVEIKDFSKKSVDKNVSEQVIKPYTVAQSLFVSGFAITGLGIGTLIIGEKGPNHSNKESQVIFCGLGGMVIGTVTADLVCKIWDSFSSQPAPAEIKDISKINVDSNVSDNRILPYTRAQNIFVLSMMGIGYGLGASVIGRWGPDHSDKERQTVFCGLGGLAFGSLTAALVCKIWDRIAPRKEN